jgi:hypothetical protein
VPVTVTNPDGDSATRSDLFAYYLGALSFNSNAYVVGQLPTGVAAADFDRDGKIDLATANAVSNTISLLAGNGDATFKAATTVITPGNGLFGVAAGQLTDGDDYPDLVAISAVSNQLLIFLNDNTGSFKAAVPYSVGIYPVAVAVAQLDGKGGVDVVTLNQSGNSVSVLLGIGDGTFAKAVDYPVHASPFGLVIADFNGDQKLDIAASNQTSQDVSVLLGQGDGTFVGPQGSSVGAFASGLAASDADGDGRMDLEVATRNGGAGLAVLRGNGDGTFQPALPYTTGGPNGSFALAVGDFNLDALVDVVADAATNVSVLLGDGTGAFSSPSHYGSVMSGSFEALVVADFDGDGKPDVAGPSAADSTLVVLHNTSQ